MRTLLLLTILITSTSSFASSWTETDQQEIVSDIAKSFRQEFWIRGYAEVQSSFIKVTKEFLDEYVEGERNEYYEEPLSREEISDLYRCYYRKSCVLYLIELSSEMHGGYGTDGKFVMMYPKKHDYDTITHTTYNE